ncbi:MAG: hypothetical protein RJA70_3141 [Pseudomonadota bacterium]
MTERVYEEVFRRASNVLASGRGVILDASFRTERQRRGALELSERHGVPLRFIQCQVPRELAVSRLTERSDGASISDGRAELYDSFAASFEPFDALNAGLSFVLDTSRTDSEQETFLRHQLS